MKISEIIGSASDESQSTDRGIILWEDEFGSVVTGPDFPWDRVSDIHLLCVVFGNSITWSRG